MVKLTRQQVEKYIALYQAKFGEELSYEEAERRGINLIILVKAILERKEESETKLIEDIEPNNQING